MLLKAKDWLICSCEEYPQPGLKSNSRLWPFTTSRNSGVFMLAKNADAILQFKCLPGQPIDIILPRSVELYVETLGIYFSSHGKFTRNIPIVKTFKWSESNNWYLLLFNFAVKYFFFNGMSFKMYFLCL